ncbi:uncharacterized protein LOC113374063 [Ctenocephalides felis]|nr:uncharacterized protein LOC113374063 [Ctenocephalides felis]XP_026470104.1 uncharacterized protein LOC113374063 [Ctenocephalides felis]
MGGQGTPVDSEYNQHLRAALTHQQYPLPRDPYQLSSELSHTPPSENASDGGAADGSSRGSTLTVNGEREFSEKVKALLEESQQIVEQLKYPFEMLPFVYAILGLSGGISEAIKNIHNGQLVVSEYSRMNNLNMYDGGELRNSTRQYG